MNRIKNYTPLLLVSLLLLASCGTGTEKKSTNETSTSVTESTTQSTNDQNETEMNLEEIASGDFSSIKGTWYEVAHGNNHVLGKDGTQYELGGTATLEITDNKIDSEGVKLGGKTLIDNNGKHELEFKLKDGTLSASLVDQMVAINWNVSFYPIGTTNAFSTDEKSDNNTQNLIVIWSSNMNLTRVFAEEPIKNNVLSNSVDLNGLSQNDFSSLVGIWTNPISGEVIEVTNETMDKPEESPAASEIGVILNQEQVDGYPTVIISGPIYDGYMQGGIGTFNPKVKMSPFTPITIIPKGVKMSDGDDSDSTKDRIIMGAGQSGVGTQAYYRD